MVVSFPALRFRCFFVVVLFIFTSAAFCQTNSARVVPSAMPLYDAHPRSVQVNVNLVLVPVSVTDDLHRPIMGLKQHNFELFEGQQAQQIRYFYQEDAPISVALVLDISGSMAKKMDLLRDAVNQFFANANSQDDYTVVTVSDRPEVLLRGSRSIDEVQTTLAGVKPAGWTALLDSVRLAAMSLKTARYPRRAILIVSDGMDNVSSHHWKEVAGLVEESDLDAYAIGVMNEALPFFGFFEERIDKKLLKRLTDVTGGRTLVVEHASEIPDAAAKLSQEMRSRVRTRISSKRRCPRSPVAEDSGEGESRRCQPARLLQKGVLHSGGLTPTCVQKFEAARGRPQVFHDRSVAVAMIVIVIIKVEQPGA